MNTRLVGMAGVALMAAVAMLGCESARTTMDTAGHRTHTVGCSGPAKAWSDCSAAAARMCGGGGFDVVRRSPDSHEAGATAAPPEMTDGFDASQDGGANRWMEIACKGP